MGTGRDIAEPSVVFHDEARECRGQPVLPREPQKVEVAPLLGLEDVLVVEPGVATRGPLRARRLGLAD